jgi:4-amino-4-deoxy-L-arabinose transferase-like glycosyltransferase
LALGLIIGLGVMAKWSFLLLVFSLGTALAVVPSTRRTYADPRSLRLPICALARAARHRLDRRPLGVARL